MKILKVKIRVLAAWNKHGQELAQAQMHTYTEKKKRRGKTLFLSYEGSLK